MADFKLGSAIIHDFKKIIKYLISKLYVQPSGLDKVLPFSYEVKLQLRKMPRYTKTEIMFFGKSFVIADADTFLVGYSHIFDKKPYLFSYDEESPWIIDCGANIGLSVIFFKLNYPDAKIIAIEPDPYLFIILKKNIESFGFKDVQVFQKAVWISNGTVSFKQEGGFSGMIKSGIDSDCISVQSISLSELLDDKKIGLLKVDIEGAENVIFSKGNLDFEYVQNVFIEYHSNSNEPQKLHDILKVLSNAGFRYHIHEEVISPSPLISRNLSLEMDMQLNIFAFRT